MQDYDNNCRNTTVVVTWRQHMKGKHITFTADSIIYRETYDSKVLDVKNNMMIISMPYHNGAIVLPGVGTVLNINVTDLGYSFKCEILERNILKKYLKVTMPGSISRNNSFPSRPTRVVSITSGKGGVGKTNFSINFGIALSALGKKVLLFDADLGMANIDVLLNVKPAFDILDVISGDKEIKDIIIDAPGGLSFIPGASGLQELAYLRDAQFNKIISGFNEIEEYFDYMLIDTGAGLSKNVTNFLLASDEIILVTTTEPHAIMDAYSIIKVLTDLNAKKNISLVINKCEAKSEALDVYKKMKATSLKFLDLDINYLGHIFEDKSVPRSIKSQVPLMLLYPDSQASLCIKNIAASYTGSALPSQESGIAGFFNKLKKLF